MSGARRFIRVFLRAFTAFGSIQRMRVVPFFLKRMRVVPFLSRSVVGLLVTRRGWIAEGLMQLLAKLPPIGGGGGQKVKFVQ